MRKVLREDCFRLSYNTHFLKVILACKRIHRPGQNGTWITNEIVDGYIKLHELGHAESVEVWEDDKLVGGLYGINLREKKVFCGESMFATVNNASKFALITLSRKLENEDYKLIDCQIYTDHLASMGAEEIPREAFLSHLK